MDCTFEALLLFPPPKEQKAANHSRIAGLFQAQVAHFVTLIAHGACVSADLVCTH